MTLSLRFARLTPAAILAACLTLSHDTGPSRPTSDGKATPRTDTRLTVTETSDANELTRSQPGFFVPNLGQWNHTARFLHRSGPMTLFLQDRGWVIDLVEKPPQPEAAANAPHSIVPDQKAPGKPKARAVALRMTFEGDRHVPEIVGEKTLPGHHNYFLGNDETRWRTDVPLYSSVRYERMYPGIDLRLREANGVPEYDLLLQPGADLSQVIVHVEGAKGMSVARDGSLIIETALCPLTQSLPNTWQTDADGTRHEVICDFKLLGSNRFGFVAPGWDGDTSLTIDPGLIWSTHLGGDSLDYCFAIDIAIDGIITAAGLTGSANFPTTIGAYNSIGLSKSQFAFVSRLDPAKSGSAQLIYSTFLGAGNDRAYDVSVDHRGVVTVLGSTSASTFPTTSNAYDRTFNGPYPSSDVFLSRLDPNKVGAAQLTYSTLLGGSSYEYGSQLSVDAGGVVTIAGDTWSSDFPMTNGAYDTTYGGGNRDVFVSRLDPNRSGSAQLVYSTFLGGSEIDAPTGVSVDTAGVITLAGGTRSTNFPTTSGAYDASYNGGNSEAFVSRLDPRRSGSAQLVYSTFLGGRLTDGATGLSVDASGVVTVAGTTDSADFPTTSGAYDTTHDRGWDTFVCRLDPSRVGTTQLVYSTFLGGGGNEIASALSVDASGVITVAGATNYSARFPTTSAAYSTTHSGGTNDVFVSRLDPSAGGSAQLSYSTYLGGSGLDQTLALAVDATGVVTVAGYTTSTDFPITNGALNAVHTSGRFLPTGFVSRLSMGVAFYADRLGLPFLRAGSQKLWLDAGAVHANQSYAIFGSVTGTNPGTTLTGIHIPLNIDPYTDITIGSATPPIFVGFRGMLDSKGEATASFHLPFLPTLPSFTLHHAYIVFDSTGKVHMASNAVPLTLN